jgi:hypothetical protein
MTIVEITGGMLPAARSFTGLSQQEVADRAPSSRPCLTAWKGSSASVPNANARALHRVVSALEAEGIEFRPNGVHLQRPTPTAGTVLHSGAAAMWTTVLAYVLDFHGAHNIRRRWIGIYVVNIRRGGVGTRSVEILRGGSHADI